MGNKQNSGTIESNLYEIPVSLAGILYVHK